ncbi:hypothetical protein LguiA_008693 [Lonicera macranthoides]
MTGPGAKVDEFVPHPVKEQFPGVDYCANSNPSWAEAIILGFQHYLVMLGNTVIISTIIVPQMGGGNAEKAQVQQTLLFVAGLNTLLQTWFGTRLPVVIGGSFRFLVPSLYIVLANRYSIYINPKTRFLETMRGIQGALLIASVIPILAGFLGVWRIFMRLLSPLSAVPLVTLVGVGLYAQGFPLLGQCIEVGLPELIILILLSQSLDRYAVLISVAIVWGYAALLTAAGAYKNAPPITQFSCRVDRSGLISGASWIKFPYPFQWGRPKVNAGDTFVMMAAVFVSLIEGVSILLDGLWGAASGSTVSVENVGLLALTRVGSRRVIQISAMFMLFFSILGKFGAVVASIPLPIVGALYCVLFAYMASGGLGLLQFCNLNSYRTKFILGFSLFMGLSVPQYFNGYVVRTGRGPIGKPIWFDKILLVIFTSPATVAAIIAIFLDCTLARKHSLTRKDSGRHWWGKFRYFDKDPRSHEFYSLPYNLSKHFPSV